jgi:hypothetical protein
MFILLLMLNFDASLAFVFLHFLPILYNDEICNETKQKKCAYEYLTLFFHKKRNNAASTPC